MELSPLASPAPHALPAIASRLFGLASCAVALLERWLTPLFDLAIRLYVGWQFFKSGWLKVQDWGSTLALFENEYHVPLLPPEAAAVMGAGGELLLPVLLVLGLAGRFGAAGLFVVNAVAVLSYPDLSDLGRADHLLWGTLLLVIVFHGPGRLSIDRWLRQALEPPASGH